MDKIVKYKCECLKCKHKIESEKHCKDLKCPKCGGEMRRVGRPGPGRSKTGNKILVMESCKAEKDSEGRITIEGYGNTKNVADRYGDIPTVFEEKRDFVYGLDSFKINPKMLLNHGRTMSDVAGSFKEELGGYAYEDNHGLKLKGVFSNSEHPAIAHARTLALEGHPQTWSIGGKWFFEDKENPTHLTLAEIYEVSLVPVPADPLAIAKDYEELEGLKDRMKDTENEGVRKQFESVCKRLGILLDVDDLEDPSQQKAEDKDKEQETIVKISLI